MHCPSCGQVNRPDRRFCAECGGRLGPTCSACGTMNDPGEKFCGRCGATLTGEAAVMPRPAAYTPRHLADKILGSRGALEGDRKQVTALFADVKGSMELAEGLDPEAWSAIMRGFFRILSEGVARFEGFVDKFTGDGIMALFGAPIAHEDHAQRACYAALHLSEALRRYAEELRRTQGLGFSVRMGLNSGEVVVGKIGDDLRMDYTAQGHTVGLAARMEQLAAPDRIYLTEHSAALVAGFFRLRDLGLFTIRGVREPVRVYELEGVGPLRTRLDVSRARGFSRFVGRDVESAVLDAALARALEGSGQIVGVVGEAGVGKSRLCYEFAQRCRARGIAVYEAHGVPHGKMIPLLPVLDMLRGYFGITECDGDQVAREKIAGRLLLLDEEFREALPIMFDFLGVSDPERHAPSMDPEARQRQFFALMKRLTHARSLREPVVLLFEDLHWIDGASEVFVENTVESISGTRTLLLLNFRPEYHASWMQRSYYQQLPLPPLGPDAIVELLHELLGADPSLAGLAHRIRERTAGSPFFMEEVVQALVEVGSLRGGKGAYRLVRPVTEVAIPVTVHGVLAARIDRLPEREKLVLQTAAVIGKDFAEPVLRRVAELPDPELAAALRALTAAELLREEALYPEVLYAFKHPLTQEVAYGALLGERRARLHAAAARAIAELHAERLDENAALLARHWEAAGVPLEAARWSRRAAEWVAATNFVEAQRHWRKVGALLRSGGESPETAALGLTARIQLLHLGSRLGMSEQDAAVVVVEAKNLATQIGDQASLAMLMVADANLRTMTGEVQAGYRHSVEAMQAADRVDDRGLQLAARVALVSAYGEMGQLRQALTSADEGLAPVPEDLRLGTIVMGFSPYVFLVRYGARLLASMGHLDQARRRVERALELARQLGEVEELGWCRAVAALVAEREGDADKALDHARQSVDIAEKLGSSFSRARAYLALGVALRMAERWSEAAEVLEQTRAISRATRSGLQFEGWMLAVLAEAYLGRGDLELARVTAEEAIDAARRRGTSVSECEALLALARVLLRTDGLAAKSAVEAILSRALALVAETGAASYEPLAYLLQAELARLTGAEGDRRHKLAEAHRLFTEMGATARAKAVEKELVP